MRDGEHQNHHPFFLDGVEQNVILAGVDAAKTGMARQLGCTHSSGLGRDQLGGPQYTLLDGRGVEMRRVALSR